MKLIDSRLKNIMDRVLITIYIIIFYQSSRDQRDSLISNL